MAPRNPSKAMPSRGPSPGHPLRCALRHFSTEMIASRTVRILLASSSVMSMLRVSSNTSVSSAHEHGASNEGETMAASGPASPARRRKVRWRVGNLQTANLPVLTRAAQPPR